MGSVGPSAKGRINGYVCVDVTKGIEIEDGKREQIPCQSCKILKPKQYCMGCYVVLSVSVLINSFKDKYLIFKKGAAKKAGQL